MIRTTCLIVLLWLLTACASGGSSVAVSESSGHAATIGENADDPDVVVEAHNATASDEEQVVCRKERSTGSHFSRKVCRTVKQMDEDREEARELMEHQPMIGVPSGN